MTTTKKVSVLGATQGQMVRLMRRHPKLRIVGEVSLGCPCFFLASQCPNLIAKSAAWNYAAVPASGMDALDDMLIATVES